MKRPRQARAWWRVALVAAAALLLANVAVFFTFTLTRLHRSRRAAEYAGELRTTAAAERAELARLKRRAQVLEDNARDTRRFFSQIVRPKAEALATDLDAIEAAVNASRLRPGRRSYAERDVRGTPLLEFAMRLPLTGPRNRLGTLLSRLEASPRFIVIDRIALRDERNASESAFNVELSTYYREADGAAAKTRSPGSSTRKAPAAR